MAKRVRTDKEKELGVWHPAAKMVNGLERIDHTTLADFPITGCEDGMRSDRQTHHGKTVGCGDRRLGFMRGNTGRGEDELVVVLSLPRAFRHRQLAAVVGVECAREHS